MTRTRFASLVDRIDIKAGKTGSSLPLLSVSQTVGVLRFSDLHDRPPRADSFDVYKVVEPGDIVFNKMSIRSGAVGVVPERGIVTYHYEVMRPRAGVDARFVVALMKSPWFISELIRNERGIGAGGAAGVRTTEVPFSVMRTIRIPQFSVEEQRAIADYLDRETAEIDAFIADQSELLSLIDEQRVAKLGERIRYPSDFSQATAPEFTRAKFVGDITLGKMLDQRAAGAHSVSAPYLRAANVQPWGHLALNDLKEMTFSTAELIRLDLRQGDVVIVEGGVGGFGRAAYLNQDIPQTGFQNSIIRIRPHESWDGRFISYALILLRHKGYIETVSSVASMPHFTAEKVAETPFPVLPHETQVSIADELDEFMRVSDSIQSEAKQSIALAHERRAALISAVVTGQVDVSTQGVSAAEQLQDDLEAKV